MSGLVFVCYGYQFTPFYDFLINFGIVPVLCYVFFMIIYRDVVFGEKQYESEKIHSDCLPFTENLPST